MFVMVPAAVGLLVLATPIVQLVYERGDFTSRTTALTVIALQCYAPGLLVFSLLKVLIPVFYAHQDMKTPVRVGIACTGLNMLLKLILVAVWQIWPFPYAYAGLAVTTVLSSTVAVVALGILVHRRLGSCGWRSMGMAGAKMLAAALFMALVALATHHALQQAAWLTSWPGLAQKLLAVLGAMAAAALTYGLTAAVLHCGELSEFWNAFRRRRGEQNK